MVKKIVHLSDLHFGTERDGLVPALVNDIREINPDIIVVSGDLTQRARIAQFKAVKHFLHSLNHPNIVCVPGNHDISLYNLIERFFYPYAKYQRWIATEFVSHLIKDNIAILGINSVTPYKSMSGYVTNKQLEAIQTFFSKIPDHLVKIIVMHHNLIHSQRHKIINDADKIINVFSKCKISLVLSGHIHHPYVELLKRNFLHENMYVITAGTPISTRTIEPNSYNVITIDEKIFHVCVRTFADNKFSMMSNLHYDLYKTEAGSRLIIK